MPGCLGAWVVYLISTNYACWMTAHQNCNFLLASCSGFSLEKLKGTNDCEPCLWAGAPSNTTQEIARKQFLVRSHLQRSPCFSANLTYSFSYFGRWVSSCVLGSTCLLCLLRETLRRQPVLIPFPGLQPPQYSLLHTQNTHSFFTTSASQAEARLRLPAFPGVRAFCLFRLLSFLLSFFLSFLFFVKTHLPTPIQTYKHTTKVLKLNLIDSCSNSLRLLGLLKQVCT